MNKDLENDYRSSVDFWNKNYELTEEAIAETMNEEVGEDDWKTLAPANKLFEALKELASCERVLDYGCGHGWASIICAKHGCKAVKAVDVAENSKTMTDLYAKVFGVSDRIDCEAVSTDWLKEQPAESYDGLFMSNVIDVMPLEIAEDILSNLKRILKKDSKVIIGMNNHITPETAEKRGFTVKEGKYLFSDGILRLSLVSDEEWTEILSKYFKIEKLDHFAWAGEEKETRRLFLCLS
jgi:cyclopropane fatty-acyl-phospholipid synthase-like methyltransferase